MLNNVIDLSHFNSVSSFQEVRDNGLVGVIHKATQGGCQIPRQPRPCA